MRNRLEEKNIFYKSKYRKSKYSSFQHSSSEVFYTWQFIVRSDGFKKELKKNINLLAMFQAKEETTQLEIELYKRKLEADFCYKWGVNFFTINKATHRKVVSGAKISLQKRDKLIKFEHVWEADFLLRIFDLSLLVAQKRLSWKKVTEKLLFEFPEFNIPRDPSTIRNKMKKINRILEEPKHINVKFHSDSFYFRS